MKFRSLEQSTSGQCPKQVASDSPPDVAQEVLQLRGVPPTPGLDAGLRRPRQGDPLPRLLRQALRPPGLRLRSHAHACLLRLGTTSHLVSILRKLIDSV